MAEELHRPTSVSVIGGINIAVGLLAVCGTPLLLLQLYAVGAPPYLLPWLPSLASYWMIWLLLDFLVALLLLVSGYGLLRLERWARRAAIGCAVLYLISWVSYDLVAAGLLVWGGVAWDSEEGMRLLLHSVLPSTRSS